MQLLVKRLSTCCTQLLLWCHCATFDKEPLLWLSSASTVVLLCNFWLRASLLTVYCFYCDAIVQLLTERLSTGCALLLLWRCFASLDWEPFFCLCSSFTVMQLCNSLTKGLFSNCAQLLQWCYCVILDCGPLFCLCSALTVLLLSNSWLSLYLTLLCFYCVAIVHLTESSLLAVLSFYCDAIVQPLTESLCSGCTQFLLWCYCAIAD